jgi:hypothetical protein
MVFSQSGRFAGPGSAGDAAGVCGTIDIDRPAALEQGKDE